MSSTSYKPDGVPKGIRTPVTAVKETLDSLCASNYLYVNNL
jgi:hypothetical protein